jgi:hypothetical protein
MRPEEDIRRKLETARATLQSVTSSMSKGMFAGLDLTGMAGTIGIIQALEWVLGDTEELHFEAPRPHQRDLEDI